MGSFAEPGVQFSEPVFAARPGATDEDDGAVITIAFKDEDPNYAELIVFDAKSFDISARVGFKTKGPVTGTLHGSFKANSTGEKIFK